MLLHYLDADDLVVADLRNDGAARNGRADDIAHAVEGNGVPVT